jgi:hypothetical protein
MAASPQSDFEAWLTKLRDVLQQHGVPPSESGKYLREYRADARSYFDRGKSPEEAADEEFFSR